MGASPDDVRDLIDTSLDDEEIDGILTFTARSIGRQYGDDDFEDETHRSDLEAALTAMRISSGRDRTVTEEQLGNARKVYADTDGTWLRGLIRQLDPGKAFSAGGVRRDSDRSVRSANNPRD